MVCFVYIVASLAIFIFMRHYIYKWLAWNLFLAFLPLIFSALALEALKRSRKIICIAAVLLWLLFFPNAPYMVTDLIHIKRLDHQQLTFNLSSLPSWFGLFFTAVGVALGMCSGLLSLDAMFRRILRAKGRVIAVLTVAAVSLLSGYAIYIGRFLRFNSWDVLRPVSLVKGLLNNFNLFTVQFSLIVAGFIGGSYFIYCFIHMKWSLNGKIQNNYDSSVSEDRRSYRQN